MSGHVFGGRRDGMRSVRRHWLVVITSALSVEERQRQQAWEQLQRFVWVMSESGQYSAGSGSVADKSQGSLWGCDKKCWPGCLSIRAWLGTISSSQIGLQTRFCWQREMLQSHFLPLPGRVPNLWDGSRGDGALTSIWTHLNAIYLPLCQWLSTEVYHVSVTLTSDSQLRPIWSNDVCCQVTSPLPQPSLFTKSPPPLTLVRI